MITSTVIKNDSPVNTGKMYKLSGVVRSMNQKAPPFLNDGTFSAIFDIYQEMKQHQWKTIINRSIIIKQQKRLGKYSIGILLTARK